MGVGSNLFSVGDQDFEAKILKSPIPMIVDFTAEWCPPCRAIAPVYERLSKEYQGKLGFARMDTDENVVIPARLGIQAAPTFMLFKDGKVIGRMIGPHPARLKDAINRILAENGIV
ncbi:MAG: thiol reductase thioredoxin [Chloroflexi bacterium]|nr:thiol reductase thioredoxin [Chloroflexota bacterium]